MKFSIRIKFFVVLIAFSLGPMLISRTLMGRQAGNMAEEISGSTHDEMLQIIRADLENNAVASLKFLDSRGQSMSLTVQLLARLAENALQSTEPPSQSELYFASNFSTGGKEPADTAPAAGYVYKIHGGTSIPLNVSLQNAAFRLPHDGSDPNRLDQAHRLNSIIPMVRDAFRELNLEAPWFNIGLESGVFLTYPGHGMFPMHYEHRNQKWYLRARDVTDKTVWTTPAMDPATRLAVATVSYPIRDKDGKFIGAASLDVPVSRIINEVSLKSRWSDQIESFLVYYDPENNEHESRLLIMAQDAYDEGKRRHWMADIEAETMNSGDPVAYAAFLKELRTKESGVVKLPHNGRDCFWAFARRDDLYFLLIAPDSVVTELPDQMSSTVNSLFQQIRDISAIVSGVMLILVGLIAWFGSKAVTKPMLVMAAAAKRLAAGDMTARINMRTGDERDQLINSFNEMVPKLKEHLDMSRDFELAHEVQNLLLPRSEPDLPGYDISGGIVFCDQTGGDYYDFIDVPNGGGRALGVVLGDVSGHGISSALLMATARGQLHSLSRVHLSPSERIQAINTVLCNDMDGTGRFLTLFYLRLGADSSSISWVRAGHDPAIRFNPNTCTFSELGGEGLALGVTGDYVYQDYEAELEPGEILVLATDGVWESRNAEGKMFGKERMLAIIRENAQKDAEGIRTALMQEVNAYQGNGQEDDIAVVVIRKVSDVSKHTIEFRVTNKQQCFKSFQAQVEELAREHDLPPKVAFHILLILDELVTNIINYGYADFHEHPIDITISIKNQTLTIRIEDDAQPFNILEAPAPELDLPLDERDRQVGGMGVHLVKSMVHLINYERKDDKNILTLTKDLAKTCPTSQGENNGS